MTDSRQFAVRAALESARTALGAMMAADGSSEPSAVAVSGGAAASAETDTRSQAARALDAWHAAERVLHALAGREDLAGQSIIAEARRQQRLSLSDAHALAALQSWADRTNNATTGIFDTRSDAERTTARDALTALEHAVELAVGTEPEAEPAAAGASSYIDSVAALGTRSAPQDDDWVDAASASTADTATVSRRGVDHRIVWGALALLVIAIGAVAAWFALAGQRTESLYRDAVAAYQRGARETARVAFARVAQDRPDDPRPLIFLGRISREEGDMPRAKRFLEAAIRRDPDNALAQREFASAMLADGQPELARRFYVRSLELDPTDRVARGFLGCALARLGRVDEARRWFDRAGPGDWLSCAGAIPSPYPNQPLYPPPTGR